MSWDGWLANVLNEGAHHCGIHGVGDGCPWTEKNMSIPPAEVQQLEKIIKTKDQGIYANGVVLCGEKWLPIREGDGLLVMRGKEDCNKQKTLTVCVSKKTVIYGANQDSSVNGNKVSSAVEVLKGQLEASDY